MGLIDSPLFPNLLYLSLVAGVWFATLAVVSPGTGLLELMAVVLLAIAGLGTVVLPLNVWAAALLVAGAGLFAISLVRKRPEAWLIASALVLSIGSVFMFRTADQLLAVHPLLAVSVSVLTMAYFWIAIRQALVAQKADPSISPARVIGEVAEVRTRLDPIGSVYALGELWTARAEKPAKPGTQVRVTGREGLVLIVEPIE